MTAFIKNLRKIRKEEAGTTMIEAMVAIALLGSISALMPIMVNATGINMSFGQDIMGINQGVVGDTATAVYDAAGKFLLENPDTVVTKEALEASGYVQLDASFVWQIGTYGRDGSDICVIMYSTEHQTEKYDGLKPAEHNPQGLSTAAASPGCWRMNKDGKYVPDWQMTGRAPASTFREQG